MIRKLIWLLLGIAITVTMQAQDKYVTFYGPLNNAWYHIRHDKKATVTFLGGSITNMNGWRTKVCDYLGAAYPGTAFRFINAGIPSLGSLPHSFRFENDVLKKGTTDLLFIEAAVNDRVNGTNELTQRRAMEGIIRHALAANPQMNIVLMAFVDEDKMADYHAGKVPVEVQVHEDLAKQYHLPFVNLAKEVTDRIDAHEFTWKEDFKDLHPAPFGQTLYFNTIKRMLDTAFNRPVPKQLTSAVLPKASDPLNYEHGAYVDIHTATNKNGFTINESWEPSDRVATREGFVKVPMLVSSCAHASVDLPFTGRTVGIGIVSGPDAGIISYSIDGGTVQQKDLRTQWSKSLYLPWFLILGDDLKPGKHVLKIVTGDAAEVTRIVHFLVNR
ncbi:GDSL-like lipase/acylhydrolase family protein [Chitinophaga polysaccharea]|uniref:GDSL-like lipase/acylhydrolase family protein n=1 Tax=Chitinophaga polysaccharea TaxID=1293035 RepID=A0A561PR41_9BACT|nr:SGNH/GDSL hydrolase family protein [Chitinophaga polysaccharea]TWF40553.1 GDSL-like lipase/acylhydrolase family protein [Chitinophaga polysaccharea]